MPHSGRRRRSAIIASARGAVGSTYHPHRRQRGLRNTRTRGIVLRLPTGSPTLNATVTNNTVSDFTDAINSLHGIHFGLSAFVAARRAIRSMFSDNLDRQCRQRPQGGVDFECALAPRTTIYSFAGYRGRQHTLPMRRRSSTRSIRPTEHFSVSRQAVEHRNDLPANGVRDPTCRLPALTPLLAAPGGVEAADRQPTNHTSGVATQSDSDPPPPRDTGGASGDATHPPIPRPPRPRIPSSSTTAC